MFHTTQSKLSTVASLIMAAIFGICVMTAISQWKNAISHPSWDSWFVWGDGLFLTAILGLSLLLISLRADTVARLVRENTRKIEDAKKALEESDRLNNAILASAGYMIIAVDMDDKVLVFNREAEHALQYTAAEIKNKQTPAIWHDPVEVSRRATELSHEAGRTILPGKDAFTFKPLRDGYEESQWTFIRKDGTRFPGHLSVRPLRDNLGKVVGFLGIIQDITEQLRQKAALEASEETFRIALEYAPIGMALVSLDGHWLRVNTALCNLLGYKPKEFAQMNFQAITHPDDLDKNLEYVRQMIAGEIQTYEMETRYFHKDGRIIWAYLNVAMARQPDGAPKYFISQIQDITERKQIEKMKSEFISTVSHELRTPLTSIRGALGLIAAGSAGAMPDTARELVNIAYNNSGRLVKIINDILDIEKIESGQIQIHLKPVDSLYILQQAMEASLLYAAKFQVNFELRSVPVGAEVMADPDRVMQVMANLLSNAIKFSPAHAVVEISAVPNGQFIRFSIKDSGIGIPEEFRARIFEKFVQADNSDSRNFEGTGLGLSITKKLVEAMHGSIGFETETGRGSTFYFDLPVAVPQTTSSLMSYVTGHSRILICEDDPDIARLLDRMLAQYGFAVDIASTLKDAEHQLSLRHYSAITLDMKMPDGSGADFARELKNNSAFSHIPVIALSGKSDEIRTQMKESAHAVKEWLTKPIDNNELLFALQRVITENMAALPFILHVEDDRDLTQVIAGSLRDQAYVVGAGNLREAHAYLKQRRFDLLIVDPILPDGSGLSLLDNLQAEVGYDLPVLILSADEVNSDVRNKVRAALVKSLMSESRITETILSFISIHPKQKVPS